MRTAYRLPVEQIGAHRLWDDDYSCAACGTRCEQGQPCECCLTTLQERDWEPAWICRCRSIEVLDRHRCGKCGSERTTAEVLT